MKPARPIQAIQFDESICQDLTRALEKEWLETNGLGGFASGTILGAHTRRYHGLLTASLDPPIQRSLLLSRVEEELLVDNNIIPLSTNLYSGTVHPLGYKHLVEFHLVPFPVWIFRHGELQVKKSVLMIHGENSVLIYYESNKPVRLRLRPLIAFRDYHSLTHENEFINKTYQSEREVIEIRLYEQLPALFLHTNAESVGGKGVWYRNFEYPEEKNRSLDHTEDIFSPFHLEFDLVSGSRAYLLASTEKKKNVNLVNLVNKEINRRRKLTKHRNPEVNHLERAADSFLVSRKDGQPTVIAGYPWFTDWGRDTMISLTGLALVNGKFKLAEKILDQFTKHIDGGMIPNRFPDAGGKPEYNTMDGTLWFFHALYQLVLATSSKGKLETGLIKKYFPVLWDIIQWHKKGTRYNIKMDEDGLLSGGTDGVQLTWMDAKVGDWVVTPRRGKPVEINTLWYQALRVTEIFARRLKLTKEERQCKKWIQLVKKNFASTFWFEEGHYLYDVVNGEEKDRSLRPNQIFAVSLPVDLLSAAQEQSVFACVEKELLTPFGLRTLATGDPNYQGIYQGNQRKRDGAYHQGTVWPWLIGAFIDALYKVKGDTPATKNRAKEIVKPFFEHLNGAGLGTISEIFDGDSPHNPKGCISQAWSVAEILRVIKQYKLF